MSAARLAGIEAGGTKFVLAVGSAPDRIEARHNIPTTTPEETLAAAAAWFRGQGALAALGIGSFGPVELDRASPRWGYITDTPKPHWSSCDIAGYFARELGLPVGFDTDVNAAALAECRLGHGRGGTVSSLAYVTVGTGIGGGLVIGGQTVHGAGHPEMGHIFPRRTAPGDDFPGVCPHHGDCLEGLASGPAVLARWGGSLSQLGAQHEAHAIVAGYLAQLCHTIFATCAAEVIVMGGGVMKTPGLLERVQSETVRIGAGYLPGRDRQRIVAPALGEDAGACGSLLLAEAMLG